jgi:hypothetical protein
LETFYCNIVIIILYFITLHIMLVILRSNFPVVCAGAMLIIFKSDFIWNDVLADFKI